MKLASKNQLVRPLKRPLNRRPAQAAQKPNSPRRVQNGDRLHINPQVKSIDTLRAAFKEYNYRAIQAHSSELLLKLALEDSRFALQAHKELLRRKDYNTVSKIANHYCDIKTKDIFDGILSDWLETKLDQGLTFNAVYLLLFSEKSNNLYPDLASQKDLKTFAKILNLIKKCGFDLNNTNIRSKIDSYTNLLKPDEIKALANLLEPISIENQQQKMISSRETSRPLQHYFESLRLTIDKLHSLRTTAKILLIGGGQSPIKQELNNLGINISITNVDPINYPNQERTADHTINEDFLIADIDGKFDEIWALWSLPLYIIDPSDINRFYTKALELLADDGVLRIFPIVLPVENSLSSREILLKPLVQKESQKVIDGLKKNPNYEVTLNYGDITIRKKPQTT